MLFRVQKNKDNPYVVMNKSFFQDANLSAKAKGILGYILTLPDDWQIYLDEVTTHFKDGRDSIRSGVNELINEGYILRERTRDEKGRLKEYIYDVYEVSTKNGKSNLGESNIGKSKVGKSNTTKYLSKQNKKKQNNNNCRKKKTPVVVSQDAELLSNNFSEKYNCEFDKVRCQELINSKGIELVKKYLDEFDGYIVDQQIDNLQAYFYASVMGEYKTPSKHKKTQQYANFKQREYDDKFYEQFYDNFDM